ncbi:MAG TPA: FAD:protein FMN transferase [Bacillota bacterium]|nr:FAD:protein FMN transferase [Bacillota bacterium]
MFKRFLCFTILIFSGLCICSCNNRNELIRQDIFAMDTYIVFTTYESADAELAIGVAKERILEIENMMSTTKPDSEVSKINANAGIRPVKVEEETFFVIKRALEYGQLTGGAFDITMLPVSLLWNITGDNPQVPDGGQISERLDLVDYRKVVVDQDERTVFLKDQGMMIDLGGIAKGYAGDEAMRILKEHNIEHAMINLGGDIITRGGKENGSPWRIGIQNPRLEESDHDQGFVAAFDITDGAIVTSGDYERYILDIYEEEGIRYHHIFDPTTGFPAKSGVISVSIKGTSGIDSDALATCVFIMGVDEGLRLINTLDSVETMIITQDKKIYFSEGFENQVDSIHPDYKD